MSPLDLALLFSWPALLLAAWEVGTRAGRIGAAR